MLLGSLARLFEEFKKKDGFHFFASKEENDDFFILQFVKERDERVHILR